MFLINDPNTLTDDQPLFKIQLLSHSRNKQRTNRIQDSGIITVRDRCRWDAFRGHGLSLLEKTTLRGLRTHAFPAGVTHLPLTRTSVKSITCYYVEYIVF